jgi:hypothetical protein
MSAIRMLLAVPVLVLVGLMQAQAADLTKIERAIAREPAYKGKPRYCLLVFGAEAKHRAWLVVDDEAVYVDRKGDGDLTAAGNRVASKNRSIKAGDLSFDGGKVQYRDLTIQRGKGLILEVSGKHRQRVIRDGQGILVPADRPQDAPIVHFDGPLGMELFSYCDNKALPLVRGERETQLAASVGTPGLGKGTFAYWVPPGDLKVRPQAEIEFVHRDSKEKPITVKVSLSSWAGEEPGCLSFGGTTVVPKDATGDKAKITLSFTDWKEGGVASRTCDIAISDPKPIGKPK